MYRYRDQSGGTVTKNHILIKSVALGVLLICSLQANASVDRALVTYFNNALYKGQSPKCSIDEATKTRILAEIEPKCLVRSTLEGQPFISGVKPACTDASVKASVDAQVNSLCANTAYETEKAMLLKKQQEAQQAATNKQNGSGSAGGAQQPSTTDMLKMGRDTYKDLNAGAKKAEEAYEKRDEVKDKLSKGWSKTKEAVGLGDKQDKAPTEQKQTETAKVEQPKPTATAIVAPVDPYEDEKRELEEEKSKLEITRNSRDVKCSGVVKDPSCESYNRKVANQEAEIASKSDALAQKEIDAAKEAADKAAKETAEELKDKPASVQKDAHDNITGEGAKAAAQATDGVKAAGDQAADAKAKAADGKADAAAAEPKATAATAPVNCQAELQAVEAANKSYNLKKTVCVKSANTADNFCDKLRSPGLAQVQQYMTLGTAVLSKVTAASEACGTTSTLSKVAQGGILAAQLTCTTVKLTCDKSCAMAKTALANFKTANAELKACATKVLASGNGKIAEGSAATPVGTVLVDQGQAEVQHAQAVHKASGTYDTLIAEEEKPATLQAKVGEDGKPAGEEVVGGSERENATLLCGKKAATDMKTMGIAALGLLSAFNDAQDCKKQLSAGGGSGNGKSTSSLAGPSMTTAEYCSVPSNAASITCKCTTDPNADGCMGSLAKSGINIGKIGNNGGASAFASAGQNGLGSLNPLSKTSSTGEELPPGANLSDAAREALGITGDATVDSAGAAAGVTSGSAAEAAKKAKLEEKEKPKFGFFSSLGNMLSGGKKPDHAAKATIRKYEQDQAIKRKLASDQVRAEISTASGKSNFDKIRSRYQQNAASFEQ